MSDDDLRAAVRAWYEEAHPGSNLQHFAVVAAGQTLEQSLGDGADIRGAWSWLVGRGQVHYVTLGLIRRFHRALERDDDS